jgi:hypothetical protein
MMNRIMVALMATLFTASFAFAQTAPIGGDKKTDTKMAGKMDGKKTSSKKKGDKKADDKKTDAKADDKKVDAKADDKMAGKMDDKKTSKKKKSDKKDDKKVDAKADNKMGGKMDGKKDDKKSVAKADPSSRKAGDYGDYTIDKSGRFHAGKDANGFKKGRFISLEDAKKLGYKGN